MLPSLREFVGRDIPFDLGPTWFIFLSIFTTLTGILAGLYPAIYLSSFQPVEVLKGSGGTITRGFRLRKMLVGAQFAAAVTFLGGSWVVADQLDFVRTTNLGFNRERVLKCDIFWHSKKIHGGSEDALFRKYRTIKQAFLRQPNVRNTTCTRFPQGFHITLGSFRPEGHDTDWQLGVFDVDEDYTEFFNIDVVSGRPLAVSDIADSSGAGLGYLINETAARQFGWDEPIGKTLASRGYGQPGTIVGVVRDFQTVHSPIKPVVTSLRPGSFKHLYLKLGPDEIPSTLADL